MNIFEKDSQFIANTYARFPLALERAKVRFVMITKVKNI
jgi:hypothetical protein